MTLVEMACLVFHFICGIPPGGFIPITCTDSLSLMVLAWEIHGFLNPLIAVTSDLYPCGNFFLFSYFIAFLAGRPR